VHYNSDATAAVVEKQHSPSQVELMVQYVTTVVACQVEVSMLGQVDQCCLVCCGIDQHLEDTLPGHDVGDRHLQCSWVTLYACNIRLKSPTSATLQTLSKSTNRMAKLLGYAD